MHPFGRAGTCRCFAAKLWIVVAGPVNAVLPSGQRLVKSPWLIFIRARRQDRKGFELESQQVDQPSVGAAFLKHR